MWATRLADELKPQTDVLTDVDTDQQDNGVETCVEVDRDSAARLGLSARDVDAALYDAFGQRQVATIYERAQPVPRGHGMAPALRRRARTRSPTSTCRRRRGVSTAASSSAPRSRPAAAARGRRQRHAGHRARQPGAARRLDRQRAQQHRHAAWCRSAPIARFVERRHADLDQPPGRRAGDDDLVQPGRGRDARPTRARRSRRPRPTSACRPTCAALPGHGAGCASSRRASSRC